MKKLFLLGLLLSASSFALNLQNYSMDRYSVYDHEEDDNCGEEAWRATHPTERQNQQAAENEWHVRNVWNNNKANVERKIEALKASYGAHPVNKRAAAMGWHNLRNAMYPVNEAKFHAVIDTLNLLSHHQRAIFDRVFKECKGE